MAALKDVTVALDWTPNANHTGAFLSYKMASAIGASKGVKNHALHLHLCMPS
jgi:hypothetical protein